MKREAENPGDSTRYLLLATDSGVQGAYSGYTQLARYIGQSSLLRRERREPDGLLERMGTAGLRAMSGSQWYRTASLQIEWEARKLYRRKSARLMHYLWGDRDWGYMDLYPAIGQPPLCATFHGCPDTLPQVIKHTSRLQRFDAIILMSNIQRSFFETMGVPTERVFVIPHGVDCEYFTPGDPKGRSTPFVVLSVGNYRRNFGELRNVCAALRHRDIRIVIVLPNDKMSLFDGLDNVQLRTRVSDIELRALYQQSSCLLMTVESATANNAILEAMACGLPIVSENVGGISEYVSRDAGFLYSPGVTVEGVRAIERLIDEPDLVERMGNAARRDAVKVNWHAIADRTVGLYEYVIANRCKPL